MRKKRFLSDDEPVIRSRRASLWETETTESEWLPRNQKAANQSPLPQTEEQSLEPSSTPLAPRQKSTLKRGHALSYAGLFLFTLVLYFRPYELIAALSSLTSMAFWIAILTLLIFFPSQLALEGTLTARPREVNFLLLFCLVALISMPLAINPLEAWEAFVEFLKVVLMFIVMVNAVRTERRLKGLLLLALAISLALSVSALSDYHAGRFGIEGQRIAGLVGGLFANPNDLALHLATMVPLVIALLLATRSLLLKLFYLACILLMVAGNIVTFSRGGFLGLMSVCIVLAWKMSRRNRVAIITLILILVVGFFAFAPGELTSRFGGGDEAAVASANARQVLLLRSILVAARHPLLGVGMGNFHIVSIHEQVSHNAYTQVAAELGLSALALYLLFMFASFKRLRQIEHETSEVRRNARFYYYLSVGLQASLVGYMVSSFFASVAYQWYVYYLVGYAICLRRIYEAKNEGAAKETLIDAKQRSAQMKLIDGTRQIALDDSRSQTEPVG